MFVSCKGDICEVKKFVYLLEVLPGAEPHVVDLAYSSKKKAEIAQKHFVEAKGIRFEIKKIEVI